MAEMLLERGADANAQVYASGSPVSQAYGQQDLQMIALLERYGGFGDFGMAAVHRNTELAKKLFAAVDDKKKAAEALLWAGACGGDPEIVRLALDYLDWSRGDQRWFGMLEQPLRFWNHGPGHWCRPEWDRSTYLTCFRMLLKRCDPNLRGRGPDRGLFGLTILQSVAGSREHVTADERVALAPARATRPPRPCAREYPARLGVSMGALGARGAVLGAWSRSRGGGRRGLGEAAGLGQKKRPPAH